MDHSPPPIVFSFEGQSVQIDPEKLLTVGESLADELHNTPRDYVRIARYLAHVNQTLEYLRVDFEKKKGERYAELKKGAYESLYGKKPTEDALTHSLNEDASLVALRKDVISLDRISEELNALRVGLQMKAEAVRETSNHVRLDKKLQSDAAYA